MFNLTRSERTALVILVTALISAAAVFIYNKTRPDIRVVVKSFDMDEESPRSAIDDTATLNEKININEAGTDELMKLKGVGAILAGRIRDYRAAGGVFAAVEDIKKVKGIGNSLFDKIKDDITVE